MMTEEDVDVERHLGEHIQACKDYVPPYVSRVTIPRVPLELVGANNKYYMPSTVTIGPYHALHIPPDSMLQSRAGAVNTIKRLVLQRFLDELPPDVTTETLIQILIRFEHPVRHCYDGISRSEMDKISFLEMMLLDGCFIVALFSPTAITNINHADFWVDLLKFDNQLPFFFLESLYKMTQHDPAGTSFADRALYFFGREVFGLRIYEFGVGHIDLSTHSINHLLHLVMIAFFHSPPTTRRLSHRSLFPSFGRPASKLEPYGVKFRKRNSRFITDIVFRNGVLEIPAIVLDGSSASLLSNLLANEMMHCVEEDGRRKRWVASYVRFMGYLIKDVNDLQILCRAGIFDCRVSDPNEMVSLFRDLSSANALMDVEDFQYWDTLIDMEDYCASVGPRVRAYLKQAYKEWDAFNGIILLILTVTQTLFSILGYSPSSGNNNKKI